jgi:hypothetical protein
LPRAALSKAFAEGLRGFAESLEPSAKPPAPVVICQLVQIVHLCIAMLKVIPAIYAIGLDVFIFISIGVKGVIYIRIHFLFFLCCL